jgi:ribonucleoside-diphosphate reductase alpha chain
MAADAACRPASCGRAILPARPSAYAGALQPFVDNAISKTINVPEAFPFEDFRRVYDLAFDLGLEGCTTYRPNPITGAVLEAADAREAPHCCLPEREAD